MEYVMAKQIPRLDLSGNVNGVRFTQVGPLERLPKGRWLATFGVGIGRKSVQGICISVTFNMDDEYFSLADTEEERGMLFRLQLLRFFLQETEKILSARPATR